MLFGRDPSGVFNYYLTLVNGGADNISTPLDTNAFKQFEAKIALKPNRNFYFALAYDTDDVRNQSYTLYDHAFVGVVQSSSLVGRRHGMETDFELAVDRFNWKTEFIYMWFPDDPDTSLQDWWGGYSQFGYFFDGDNNRGIQGIFRGEFTRMHGSTGSNKNYDLASGVFGLNGFINPNLNLQVNYIMEFPNEHIASAQYSAIYAAKNVKHIGYAELQVKF